MFCDPNTSAAAPGHIPVDHDHVGCAAVLCQLLNTNHWPLGSGSGNEMPGLPRLPFRRPFGHGQNACLV